MTEMTKEWAIKKIESYGLSANYVDATYLATILLKHERAMTRYDECKEDVSWARGEIIRLRAAGYKHDILETMEIYEFVMSASPNRPLVLEPEMLRLLQAELGLIENQAPGIPVSVWLESERGKRQTPRRCQAP